jgi:hypothetical protein
MQSSQIVVETATPNQDSPVYDNLCPTEIEPVIFCSIGIGSELRHWYSMLDLPDDEDYYGGWKEDRLLSISDVRRSLSGPSSAYEVGTFSVELADEDYAIRELLATDPGKFYSRIDVDAYIITPVGRAFGLSALTLGTGRVEADPEFDPRDQAMSVKLSCRDRIGVAMGWTANGQSKLPRRILNQTTLPGVIARMSGKGSCIPYGYLTNQPPNDTLPAPSVVTYPDKGSFDTGDGRITAAFAPWNSDIDSPVGVMVTTSSGGSVSLVGPAGANYQVQVFPRKAGRVGNPTPWVAENAPITVTPGNQTVNVSWTNGGSNVDDHLVILSYPDPSVTHRSYFIQSLIATGTSVAFTVSPPAWAPAAKPIDASAYTPDTILLAEGNTALYTLRAKDGVSRSPLIDPTIVAYSPVRFPNGTIRPIRVYFNPTGVPQYELVVANPSDPIAWQWILTKPNTLIEASLNYIDDTWNYAAAVPFSSQVSTRPVGRLRGDYVRTIELITGGSGSVSAGTWGEIHIAGVPLKALETCYYDTGNPSDAVEINPADGDIIYPKAGSDWDTYFPTRYRDIIGADGVSRRYTMAYVRGSRLQALASGSATISFDVQGVEYRGDGEGVLITDLHDQFFHLLNYFVVAPGEGYTSGLYGTAPRQGYDNRYIVDQASFIEVRDMRLAEIPGGLPGVGVVGALGELVDVATEMKRWCMSGDFRIGPNRNWQIVARAIDKNLSPLFISEILTDEFDIQARTFKPQPRISELQNVFQVKSKRNYVTSGWFVEGQTYIDAVSVDNWDLTKQGEDLEFSYLEDPIAVDLVFGRHRERRVNAPMYATLIGSMCLVDSAYDIGKYVKIKHWRGVAAGGWTNRVFWILDNTFLSRTKQVQLDLLDVTDLISNDYGLLEEQMDIDLGGSWYNEVPIATDYEVVNVAEYRDRNIPWSSLPPGTVATARIYALVPSGAWAQAHLYDPNNNVIAATDPLPYTGTGFELHTFVVPPLLVDTEYRLRMTVSGAAGRSLPFLGIIRTELP